MTTSELIQSFNQKVGVAVDLDPIAADSDAEVVSWLNQGLVLIGRAIQLHNPILTINPNVFPVDLNLYNVISIKNITLNGAKLIPIVGDTDNMITTPGVPTHWYQSGSTLYLSPTPSASSLSLTLDCSILPNRLSTLNPTASPNIPLSLHDHLVNLAIVLSCRPSATEQRQIMLLNNLESNAYAEIDKIKRLTVSQKIIPQNTRYVRRTI